MRLTTQKSHLTWNVQLYKKKYPREFSKIVKVIFPVVLLSKSHRKSNGCLVSADGVDGNVSENEEELNVEFKGNEIENSVSNTAPIFNILEILA